VVWKVHDGPQTLLVTCPLKDIFYGGERGGGKTGGLIIDFVSHASRYGKYARGIIFRRSYPETEDIVTQGQDLLCSIGWEYLKGDRMFVAPDGATLRVRYLEGVEDAAVYQGQSNTWLGFDEAGSWATPEPLDLVSATLRSPHGVPCVRRVTGNPGGVGHQWLKRRYVDPAPAGTVFTSEVGTQAVFIPASMEDNPSLGEDYEQNIKAATFGNEALWKAWRFGSWDVILGAAFSNFDPKVHVVRDRPYNQGFDLVFSIDWGYAKGAALAAMVRTDRVEVMESLELERLTAREAGTMLATKWGHYGQPKYFLYSPDMDTETGVGTTLTGEFLEGWHSVRKEYPPMLAGVQKHGSRRAKFVLMQEALLWEDDRDEKGTLRQGAAPFLVMQDRARYLRESLPILPLDKKDPSDIDTKADDHGYDSLGFILAVHQPPPSAQTSVSYSDTDRINKTTWLHPSKGVSRKGDPFRPKKTIQEDQKRTFGPPIPSGQRITSPDGL